MMRRIKELPLVAIAMATLLAGCANTVYPDHPVTRKFTWFNYVKGTDIAEKCVAGAPDRYRFVYNGVYTEQVRSYDVEPTVESGRYRMTTRVTEKANLTEFVTDPTAPDPFKPWHPKVSVIDLPAEEIERLQSAVLASGFIANPPPARSVSSIEFYWAIAACLDGTFRRNAYVWPTEAFQNAPFPRLLAAWDMTDIPFNLPRETSEFSIYGTTDDREYFNLFKLRFDGT